MSRSRSTPVFSDADSANIDRFERYARFVLTGISAGYLTGVLFTTQYAVDQHEQAVVTTFGAYTTTEGPGLQFKLPAPIQDVIEVPTQQVQRLEMGYRTKGKDSSGNWQYDHKPEDVTMMTKDENIAIVEFSVQYRIDDISDYLFNVKEPEKMLTDIARAAMRSVVADYDIDSVLITEKTIIQTKVRDEMQRLAKLYGTGVTIITVQAQDVRPPKEVQPAFNDVQTALEDAEGYKNEGQKHYNQVTTEAAGTAYKVLQEAQAYSTQRINEAKGDAKRFDELYAAYRADPDITRRQLYLQEMEHILRKAHKIIVDADVDVNLFLEKAGR